jgi:hypothetical protein
MDLASRPETIALRVVRKTRLLTALMAALATALIAAAPHDTAVIVDSGSTNTLGYKIEVSPDGTASLTPHNRYGAAPGAAKTFTLTTATATRFFADLQAARKANATGEPCMKSASFGTKTTVTWRGWTSPDLDCPPGNSHMAALVRDVGEIRQKAGVSTAPLNRVPLAPGPASTSTPQDGSPT